MLRDASASYEVELPGQSPEIGRSPKRKRRRPGPHSEKIRVMPAAGRTEAGRERQVPVSDWQKLARTGRCRSRFGGWYRSIVDVVDIGSRTSL